MILNISFVHWLVIVALGIGSFGTIVYIRDTLRGTTKPNRVSWFMWSAAPLIGAGSAIHAGADPWVVSRILFSGLSPLFIFTASFFNPKGYWKLTTFDVTCGLFAVAALVAWLLVDLPRLAIILAVIGDGFAVLPTLRKAWWYPETETGTAYITGLLSLLLIMPSIQFWNIENAAFQIYLLVANILLALFVYRKRLS